MTPHEDFTPSFPPRKPRPESRMHCNLRDLSQLLLRQWPRLTADEVRATRHVKSRIARLLETKYGIHHRIAEHYLTSVEGQMAH